MKLAALACLFICATCAHGQQFWNGTSFGTTKAAVRSKFGSKVKPEPGDANVLTMGHSFCGTDFEVAFSFTGSDRLEEVVLSGKGGQGSTAVARCAIKEYIGAFGKPETSEETAMGMRYLFRRSSTIVEITVLEITDLVLIKYRLKKQEL